jgi:hypothetical protein
MKSSLLFNMLTIPVDVKDHTLCMSNNEHEGLRIAVMVPFLANGLKLTLL